MVALPSGKVMQLVQAPGVRVSGGRVALRRIEPLASFMPSDSRQIHRPAVERGDGVERRDAHSPMVRP